MKRFIAIILCLALALPAQGAVFVFDDFSKGLNSHISEYSLSPNQSAELRNLRVNYEYGNLAKRDPRIQYVDAGSSEITGLHRYYVSDGSEYTIIANSTNIEYTQGSSTTNLKTDLNDGLRTSFVTYNDNVIATNGTDQPIKWDGSTAAASDTDGARTSDNLMAEVGAPFAELDTGTDLDASSWYQYKVMFYDGTNTYYSTAVSNPIQTGSSVYNIALTDIPLGDSTITERYIYRTEGQSTKADLASANYKLVDTISDNSTTTYSDSTADGSLTTAWDESGKYDVTPPTGKYCLIHQQRLFIAGNSTYGSRVYWSDEFNPDFFSRLDYERIRPNDGDEITFIANLLNILVIGKNNTIQKLYTDTASESDWYPSNPFSYIGCIAPYSVATSPIGVIYYGRNGIYRFTGQRSQLISDAVTEQINDVSQIALDDVFGYYYDNKYYLAYRSTDSGASINNRVLIYDIIRDSYMLDTIEVNCMTAFSGSDDFGTLHSGDPSTDGIIWAHEFNPRNLSIMYKSDLDAGTFDDARTYGTEDNPYLEISWDCTIDTWLTELQSRDGSISTIDDIGTYLPNAIIDRPDTDGSWTSEIYRINAGSLDELNWNEDLNIYGDVTLQIKTCDDSACSGDSFGSTYTDSTGSDVSGETAEDWVQFKVNLSTSDINYTPLLFKGSGDVIKLTYTITGDTKENDFLSKWNSGWRNFTPSTNLKTLKRIKIYYQGTEGDLDFRYYNEEGDIDNTFTIDLSIAPDESSEDKYMGFGDSKVYTYFPPLNENGLNPTGQLWRFEVTNEDITQFTIDRIEVVYEPEEYYPWE